MYTTLLTIHSTLRWLVIGFGIAASALAMRSTGSAAAASSANGDNAAATAGMLFTVAFDLQVLVGLLLYLRFSSITTTALHAMGPAMSNTVTRFWAVEHPFGMIAALALAHVGRVRWRAGAADPRRRRSGAIFIAVATVLVIISTPWPFLPYGRPLL